MSSIYHVSDPHFRPWEREDDWTEQEALADAIVAGAAAARPSLIALGGDWDALLRTRLHERVRLLIVDTVTRLAAIAPVVSIRGNHDRRGTVERGAAASIPLRVPYASGDLAHLNSIRPVAGASYGVIHTEVAWAGHVGGFHVLAVPYPETDWLCPVPPAVGERLTETETELRALVRGWLDSTPADEPRVILCHCDGFGAVVKIAQHRETAEPSLRAEDVDGASAVLCGHIHTAQSERLLSGTLIGFVGQPKPEKFGDPGQEAMGAWNWTFDGAHCIGTERVSFADVYRRKLEYSLAWDPAAADGAGGLLWSDCTPFEGVPSTGPLGYLTAPEYVGRARVKVKLTYPASARAAVQALDVEGAFLAAGAWTVAVDNDVVIEAHRPAIVEFRDDSPRPLRQELDLVIAANGQEPTPEDLAWLDDSVLDLDTAA